LAEAFAHVAIDVDNGNCHATPPRLCGGPASGRMNGKMLTPVQIIEKFNYRLSIFNFPDKGDVGPFADKEIKIHAKLAGTPCSRSFRIGGLR
jgi:hypothetical protein